MKRIFYNLFFPVFFFITTNLLAQQTALDSLRNAFEKTDSDTARLSMLVKANYNAFLVQSDVILKLLIKGQECAQRLGDTKGMVRMINLTGYVYLYGKAKEGEAFKWFQKGLQMAEKSALYGECATASYSMGIIYDHQGFRNKMYEYFEKSRAYSDKDNKPHTSSLLALLVSYTGDKRFDEAINLNEKCIQLIKKYDLSPPEQLKIYGTLMEVLKYLPNGYQEKKIAVYRDKILILSNLIDYKGHPDLLAFIARLCVLIKKPSLAIKYSNEVLALPETDELTAGSKVDAYMHLANAYAQLKNYSLSNENWQQYAHQLIALKTRAMTEDAGRKVIKVEAERDLLIKQQEVNRQKWWSVLGFSVAALVLVAGVVVYRYYRREQQRKQELAALNTTKDQLMSIIAHDLRSPIGLLRDSFDLMDNNLQSPEETKQFLSQSRERIERVHSSMENLLVWALAQRNGLNPKFAPVKVAELVAEQVAAVQEFAHRKAITLQNDTPTHLMAWADGNQLMIVLNNLLQNAIKFTPSGGTIRVSAEETGDKLLTLQVADTGVGMDIAVWKKQQQTQTLLSKEGTAKEKGTGLGLFLVKEIMDKNEGTFHIESKQGSGTTVSIGLKKAA